MNGPIKQVLEGEIEKVKMWNRRYDVGQKVVFKRVGGKWIDTFTTSKALLNGGHTAMVGIEYLQARVDLDRLIAID